MRYSRLSLTFLIAIVPVLVFLNNPLNKNCENKYVNTVSLTNKNYSMNW